MNSQEKLQMINGLLREVEVEEKTTLPVSCVLGSANQGGNVSYALSGRLNLHETAVIGNFNEEEPETIKEAVRSAYKEMLNKLSESLIKLQAAAPEELEEEDGSSET